MLDNDGQVKAYKLLQSHPVTLPYSHIKCDEIVAKAALEVAVWSPMVLPGTTYPPAMYPAINDIGTITNSFGEARDAAKAMIDALSDAETPNNFITLGIGWDVIKKTEDNPPAEFLINKCIADRVTVDAVIEGMDGINSVEVKRLMDEINELLNTPPAGGEDPPAGGVTPPATVPDSKIAELITALEPEYTASTTLSYAAVDLSTLSAGGKESKIKAVKAFNDAVTIAVIGATTGGDGIMNDVMSSVVNQEIIDALRG